MRVADVRADDAEDVRSCYESNGEPGFGPEWVHEQAPDGSCKCGHYASRV